MDYRLNEEKRKKYLDSLQDELDVKELLEKTKGGTIQKASNSEDMNSHVDLWWFYKDKKIGIDVKGKRKNVKDKEKYDYNIQWLELRGVGNRKGWLFGDETYIMFLTEFSIIVLTKEKAQECVKNLLNDDELFEMCQKDELIPFEKDFMNKHDIKTNNLRFYKPHTRWSYDKTPRHDISIKVKIDDLRQYMSEELFF